MTRQPWPAQRLGAALADFAEPAHDGDLAAEHDVGRAREAVGQRVAAAVDVVELALGHRVVDVDGGEEQRARFHHLIETVHAGRRLLADAADRRGDARPARPLSFAIDRLIRSRMTPHSSGCRVGVERRHVPGLLELRALVHHQRRVAAIVHDQRRAGAVGPLERFARAPPVLLERLALPGEHRRALRLPRRAAGFRPADDDGGGGVILRREDVARDPAHVGAELGQRLDEHGRLNRHVQAAHDAGAGERLLARRAASRSAISPGISCSASRISLRPNSASDRSFTLYGSRPAALRRRERMQLLSNSRHRFSSPCGHEDTKSRQDHLEFYFVRSYVVASRSSSRCDEQSRSLGLASGGSGTIRISSNPHRVSMRRV